MSAPIGPAISWALWLLIALAASVCGSADSSSAAALSLNTRELLEVAQSPPPPPPPPPPPDAGSGGASSMVATDGTPPAPTASRLQAAPSVQTGSGEYLEQPPPPIAPPRTVLPAPAAPPKQPTSPPTLPMPAPPPETAANATATLGAPEATGAGISGTAAEIVALHNGYRARHVDTPPLTWSSSLEASATAWAQRCVFGHSGDPGVGENVYEMEDYPRNTGLDAEAGWQSAMSAWYETEIDSYNWAAPYYSEANGHFTQVVWAATRQVGCGRAVGCPDSMQGRPDWEMSIYVCQYQPPGNVLSTEEFQANVHSLQAGGGGAGAASAVAADNASSAG